MLRSRGAIVQCLRCERYCAYWRGKNRPENLDPSIRRLNARGLCNACYLYAKRAGELHEYPQAMTTDEIVSEVEALLATRPDAAAVLRAMGGVAPATVARRMRRAGRADLARPFDVLAARENRTVRRLYGG